MFTSVSEGMFLMRKLDSGKVIYPQEDVNNKGGGYRSFKINKEDAQDGGLNCRVFYLGECICVNTSLCM